MVWNEFRKYAGAVLEIWISWGCTHQYRDYCADSLDHETEEMDVEDPLTSKINCINYEGYIAKIE